MDLQFSEEDEAFRQEVRSFLSAHLPVELAAREAQWSHLDRTACGPWQQIIYEKGWAAPLWPAKFGGTGWSPFQKHIYEVEYGLANAPELSVVAINLVGPLLCAFGSAEQQQRFLAPILRGDIYFCQGFSEPQAGSDLAAVKTRAVRQGERYTIHGQKTWTSHARDADYMICLARTNPEVKPQRGLSLFLLPMDAPGVVVRPLETIDGRRSLNEVFLDGVVVTASDRLGEEDQAWSYTKFLLDNERTHNAYIGILKRYVERMRRTLSADTGSGRPSATLRARFHQMDMDVTALEWSVLRVIAATNGKASPAAASALKVRGSDLLIRAGELELDLAGPMALADFFPDLDGGNPSQQTSSEAGLINQYMYWRASSIFGGANEIQRTIIWNTQFR